MVLAPRDVYSALVENHSSRFLRLLVTYGKSSGTFEEKFDAAPGATVTIPERTYKDGEAMFVCPVKRIRVHEKGAELASSLSSLVAPFPGVYSPTRKYPLYVDESLKLHSKHE